MSGAAAEPRGGAAGSAAAFETLRCGELEVLGRLVDASNVTLYATVGRDGDQFPVVYKPVSGERPLWDFPDRTLARREVAAYEMSVATGWDLVPPTVLRDGPFGPGMVQRWIDVDTDVDVVALARSDHPQLRRLAVLDTVINNADRKGSHLLPDYEGHVWAVDHGVCFSTDEKLRTVLWRWRGKRLTHEAVEVLERLRDDLEADLGNRLGRLLSAAEIAVTRRRVRRLLASGRHPMPSDDWPPVPWPPF